MKRRFCLIVKRKSDSVTVPRELLVRDDISLGAKGLYAYLLLMDEELVQYVTVAGICHDLNENEKVVKVMLYQLEQYGYVADIK
jgi:hypothetical protein